MTEWRVCFIKFRDHTKLGGITRILEAMIRIQKALKKTEKLSKSWSSLRNVYNTAVIRKYLYKFRTNSTKV